MMENIDNSEHYNQWQPQQQQRYPLPIDVTITVLLFVATVLPGIFMLPRVFLLDINRELRPGTSVLLWLLAAMLLSLSQLLRTLKPQLMLIMATLGAVIHVIAFDSPSWAIAAVPFCVYSYARYVPDRTSRLVVVIGAVGAVLGPIRWFQLWDLTAVNRQTSISLSQINAALSVMLICAAAVVVPYLAGRMINDRTSRESERIFVAQQQARNAALRNEEQAHVAQMRARTEIARELHDIVAHSLSVMVIQADGGRAAARSGDTEAAVNALGAVGDTGRDALTEMRRIVGVLRGENNVASDARVDFAPNPGLTDINTLIARSGDRVTLEVNGVMPQNVAPAVALTAYRIVQEGLTNFLKHAGAQAQAKVRLSYAPHQLSVNISDNGTGGSNGETGYGLRGMSERVSAVGGRFSAGPGSDGGFIVSATIPLPSTPPTATQWTPYSGSGT
ncbi:MAG: histidine kinase [Propionibacteriaceae bacterium]|nr:histidine kinase [Propionibacteriaceae bacterium]